MNFAGVTIRGVALEMSQDMQYFPRKRRQVHFLAKYHTLTISILGGAEDKNGSWRVRVAEAKEVRVSRQPGGGATNVLALVVNTHGSASQQPR